MIRVILYDATAVKRVKQRLVERVSKTENIKFGDTTVEINNICWNFMPRAIKIGRTDFKPLDKSEISDRLADVLNTEEVCICDDANCVQYIKKVDERVSLR